jgi:hypothetical protein
MVQIARASQSRSSRPATGLPLNDIQPPMKRHHRRFHPFTCTLARDNSNPTRSTRPNSDCQSYDRRERQNPGIMPDLPVAS